MRTTWRACLNLFSVLCVSSIGIYLSLKGEIVFWLTGQAILGVAMWQWFTVLHSCGHHAFFRNRMANNVLGMAASVFCTLPYYPWLYIHHKHHIWVGWRDIDPTNQDIRENSLPAWQRVIIDFCWRFWIPLFSTVYIYGTFWNLPRANAVVNKRHQKLQNLVSIIFVAAVISALIYFYGLTFFKVTGLAYFIFLSISDLSVLTQHVYLPTHKSGGQKAVPFSLQDQNAFSRTMLMPKFVSKYIFGNFNLHSAHHAYPLVPHYLLDKVPFQPVHGLHWKVWLSDAKKIPAHKLLFEEPSGQNEA